MVIGWGGCVAPCTGAPTSGNHQRLPKTSGAGTQFASRSKQQQQPQQLKNIFSRCFFSTHFLGGLTLSSSSIVQDSVQPAGSCQRRHMLPSQAARQPGSKGGTHRPGGDGAGGIGCQLSSAALDCNVVVDLLVSRALLVGGAAARRCQEVLHERVVLGAVAAAGGGSRRQQGGSLGTEQRGS